MTTAPKTSAKSPAYENNPFFVAVNGLEILFKKAQAIGIALAVLTGVSFLSSLPSALAPPADEPNRVSNIQSTSEAQKFAKDIAAVPIEVWLTIALVILVLLLVIATIGIIIRGVVDYTSAQLAHDKQVSLSEAFRAVFTNFWGYTWVLFIAGVKTFLWTLLFIIPGIIMSIRYSLAGVVYFDKKLSGNGSVKESARLTKGGWLTTYASQALFNIITLGAIKPLLVPGTQAVLYRQFKSYDVAGTKKPAAHILSWLTLVLPLIFVTLLILGIVLLLSLAIASSK